MVLANACLTGQIKPNTVYTQVYRFANGVELNSSLRTKTHTGRKKFPNFLRTLKVKENVSQTLFQHRKLRLAFFNESNKITLAYVDEGLQNISLQ